MIIWQGLGFLVVVFLFAALLGVQYTVDAFFGAGFYTQTAWIKVVAAAVAAVPIGMLGYKLNNQEGKLLIDPETNQQIRLVKKHTLFWIPMQYWAPLSIAFAVYMTYFFK